MAQPVLWAGLRPDGRSRTRQSFVRLEALNLTVEAQDYIKIIPETKAPHILEMPGT